MSSNRSELVKVILLGDTQVGKTSLMQRWAGKPLNPAYVSTIGVDFEKKQINNDTNSSIQLQIWDTAGQDRFQSIAASYYRQAHIAVMVFDVTNQISLSKLNTYLEKIKKYAAPNISIVLVGNKVDLAERRVVSELEAKAFAQEHSLIYLETSTTNKGDVLALESIVLGIRNHKEHIKQTATASSLLKTVKKLQELDKKNENMKWISDFLQSILSVDPKSIDLNNKVKVNQVELEKNLNSLWWTGKSFFNSVVNLIITVFLTVSVVGMPIAYLTGLLEKNKQESGHFCMFFKFGEYQMAKAKSNQVFAEVGVMHRL